MHPDKTPAQAACARFSVCAGGWCALAALLLLASPAWGAAAPTDASAPAATAAGSVAPAPPQAPQPLEEAVGAVSDTLRALRLPRARYTIDCVRRRLLLDSYVATTLAAQLESAGGSAHCMNGSSPASADPFGDQLQGWLLQSLRTDGATVFVRLGTSVEEHQRVITLAVYDVADGRSLKKMRVPFQLPTELEVLVTEEGQALSDPDKDWLTLFDELFPAAPAPQNADWPVQLAQARFLLNSGLWAEAAHRFTELAGAATNRLLVRAVMARRLSGDGDGAQALVQSALKLQFDSGPLYALDGWVALRQGRPADALVLLEQARLSDMSREGLYSYARGLIALERKDYDGAEQALKRAADLLPDKLFAQQQLARFYWHRARLQDALRYYRRATKTSAVTAETWAELAMVLDASDDLDGAVNALRQAFRMRSDNPVITRQLASLLKRQGDFEGSLEILRRAKEANPCSPALLAAYGDGAAEMWRIPEAESAFREAVAASGEFPYAVARLAEMLRLQRRYVEAQGLLMNLLADSPDYQPARLELGRILGELGRAKEAASALAEAAKSPQYEVDARLALAKLYLDQKQPDEAVSDAQIAVSLRPDAQTYAVLSQAFLTVGDADKALTTAKSALQKGAESADAHLAMARVLYANGQTEDALREGEAAQKLNPYSVDALSLLGTLRQNMGDSRECAALWQRALGLDPWDAELHYRLAELLGKTLRDSNGALEHYNRYFELEKMRTGAAG